MKTASDYLKNKNTIPTDAVEHSVSQPGPEDGRDQNIKPDSNSYDSDNGKSKRLINHNEEVYRSDEDDSEKVRVEKR
ncbi:MAG: hypothetical protein ABIQ27_07150 [Flavobacterium sp.]|uniref:hypothetical protein n=1 Tax=Flavobacterium sp. TaxID=239 RepID=UPI00326512C9